MISDADIDGHALEVVHKLKQAGFEAYLVGGCVRDLLLKCKPKDFDVATNAQPSEIKKLFRNCRLIGRRFRLAHIFFERKIIEVATFRGPPLSESSETKNEHGLLVRDNVYGSLEEDVWRRDFTVNAFYYDPDDNRLVDLANGMPDLQHRVLRVIGDPERRFREDPVRMLRAIRFAAKLDFAIEEKTAAPIKILSSLLLPISHARLFEEVLKLFHSGFALKTYQLLRAHDLFDKLFAQTEALFKTDVGEQMAQLLIYTLESTDARIHADKTVTPAFLYSVLLWHPLKIRLAECVKTEPKIFLALEMAMSEVLRTQQRSTAIPRYLTQAIREIWTLQLQLENPRGRKPLLLLQQPRFRAAYDLLMLRIKTGEIEPGIGEWWTIFQEVEPSVRMDMLKKRQAELLANKRVQRPKKRAKKAS